MCWDVLFVSMTHCFEGAHTLDMVHPQSYINYGTLYQWIADNGHVLQSIPFNEWRELVKSKDSALSPLSFYFDHGFPNHFEASCEQEVKRLGSQLPHDRVVNASTVNMYISYYQKKNHL